MAWWNDTLDLGATDYQDEDDQGIDRFLAPPQPRAYQPFRGNQPSVSPSADRYDQVLQSERRQPYSRYTSPLDELDAFEGFQTRQDYADKDAAVAEDSAKLWEGRYDDFVKNKLKPFHQKLGLVDLAETDDDYFNQIEDAHKKALLLSQEPDGFFGESKDKERAKERLNLFGEWGGNNGLGAQYKSFRDEAIGRRRMADGAEALNIGMQEAMSAIPVAERVRMEEELSARKKAPRSKKATDDLLDSLHFDSPNYWNGMLLNPDDIDPRTKVAPSEGFWGGVTDSNLRKKLNTRMSAAMKGDIKGVVGRRERVQMDRAARDRGELFSYPNGTMDGVHPVGLSRKDADLLDLERMRKAGMTEFKGKPLEEMMEQLGGRERLKMARVMETVYNTKNNWQQAQLDFIKSAGSSKSIKLAKRMRAAERTKDNAIKLAAKYGLDNELFQQAESVGWLQGIGNAVKRGLLMHEQSRYGLDFLTNTLDQDEMQRLIDINEEMTDLPSSTFFERYKKADKATGMGDALWKLLGEPMVWPEMFVESMSALLPTAFMVGLPAMAAGGAMTVASRGKLPGALGAVSPAKQTLHTLSNFRRGGQLGAAVGSGVSSALLEGSGMVLEALQELNINIKDPKVFAAAWNNESIRRKVVDSGVKKGLPIGIMDGISASFAGRVAGLGMHTRNALWKGGKLIDPKALDQAVRDVPRFTKFSRAASVGAELGFDVASGMGGEYLGQLWEKDAGEDFDYDAIAAEGIIGFGPGAIGGIVEWNRNRPANVSFEDTTLDYTDMQQGPDGSTFRVTRAGWTERGFTRNTSDGMTSELLSRSPQIKSADDPRAMATQDFLARMYAANPEKMASLRVVLAKRTPVSGGEQLAGSFEVDQDGNPVMYLNKDQFGENPIPVFMHESGHLARLMVFENVEDLYTLYDSLDADAKKQAFFDYHAKLGEDYASQSPEVKKKTEAAYRKLGNEKRAEEWFAYQWASLLAGKTVDKSVKNELHKFLTAHILPFAKEYTASDTETLAGSNKETTIRVQQDILRWMGHTPHGTLGSAMLGLGRLGTPEASLQTTGRIVDPAMGAYGTAVDFGQEGIRAPAGSLGDWDALNDQDGLNHLIEGIRNLFSEQLQLEGKRHLEDMTSRSPEQELEILELKKEYFENMATFLRILFPNAGILDDLNERSFFTEEELLVYADAAMAEQAAAPIAEPREATTLADILPERDSKGKPVVAPSTDPEVISRQKAIDKLDARMQELAGPESEREVRRKKPEPPREATQEDVQLMRERDPDSTVEVGDVIQGETQSSEAAPYAHHMAWTTETSRDWTGVPQETIDKYRRLEEKRTSLQSEIAKLEKAGQVPSAYDPNAPRDQGVAPQPSTEELQRMADLDMLLPRARVSKEKDRWKVTKGYPGYRDYSDTDLTYATEEEAEAAADKFLSEEFKAIEARTKNLKSLKDMVLTPGKFKTAYNKAVKKLKGELAPRGWTATRKYSKNHWVVYEGNTYEAQKDIGVEKNPKTNKRKPNVNPEESPDWNLVKDATVTDADVANIPDAAIAAEILGFDKLQAESMFGSAHMGRSLAEAWDESRPGAVGEEALAEELFKYDQDVEGARTALEGRRDELRNDLRRIGVALIEGQMQGPLEVDPKTEKPKSWKGTTLGERTRSAMETVFKDVEMENFPAIVGKLTTKKGKGDIVGHDVKALQKKLKMVNDYLQQLVPEEYGVDWKDEEHVWLEWEVWDLDAVGDAGKQDVIIKGEETGQLLMRAPVTLGQLAVSSSIDSVKNSISDYDGHRIQRRLVNTRSPIKNGRKQLAGKQSSGQRVLSEYVARPRTPDATSGTYDESNQNAPVPESYKTKDPTVGRKKYRAMLDAVRASMLASKIDTLKKKPMGHPRTKKGKELPQTRDIGGFSVDRGTSLAALVLERIGNIREDAARDATKEWKEKAAAEKARLEAPGKEAAKEAAETGTSLLGGKLRDPDPAPVEEKTREPLPFRDLTPTEEAVLFYGGRRGDALSEYYNRPEYLKMNMLIRRHARLQERIREAQTKPPSATDLEKEISAEDKAKYAKGRKRAERAGDVPERSLLQLEKRMMAQMMALETQIGGYSEKLEEFPSILSDEGTGRESLKWDKVLEHWVWAHTKEKALNQMLDYWESDLAVESIDDDRRRGTRKDEIDEHVDSIRRARQAAISLSKELDAEGKIAEGKEPFLGKGAWKRELKLPDTPYGEARSYSELQDAIDAKDAEIAAHQARYQSITGDKGTRLTEEMDALLAERSRAYRYHHPGDPGMDTSEKIPAREGMFKSFTRSKVDEGIDIRPFLSAFADPEGIPEGGTFELFGSNIDLQGDTTAAVTKEDVFDDNGNFKGRYKDDLPRGKDNNIELVIKGEKRYLFWGEAGPTRPEGWRWLNFRELNKSDNLDANEAWINLKQEEITGSLKNNYIVSAAELAHWFLVNRDGKNGVDTLAILPSSEQPKGDKLVQRPGAPGQGLIPLVWDNLIRAMYTQLGITAEPNRTAPKEGQKPAVPKFIKDKFPEGEVVIKGRKQQGTMTSKGGFTQADMEKDLIPILQAAIDAGRVDLFGMAEMDKKSDEDIRTSMPRDFKPETEADPNEKGTKLKPEKEGATADDAPDDPGGIADEDALATGPVSRETQKKYLSGLRSKEDKKAAWDMLLKIKASPAAKKLKKFLADRIASGNLELRSLTIADEFPLSEGLDGKSKRTSVSGIDNPSIWELFELPPPPEMTPALRKLKANVPGYESAARVQQIKEWYEDLKKGKYFKQLMFLIEGNVHDILGSRQGKNKSIKEIITEMFTGVVRRLKPAVREPKEEEKTDNSRRDFLKSLGWGAVSSVTGLPSAKSVAAVAKATGMSATQAAKGALLRSMVKSEALRETAANRARTVMKQMRGVRDSLLEKSLSRVQSDSNEYGAIRERRMAKRLKREAEGSPYLLPDEKSPVKRGDFIEDYITRTKEQYPMEPGLEGQYPSEDSLRSEAEYAWEYWQIDLLDARGLEYFWDEEIYNFHPKVAAKNAALWTAAMRDEVQTLLEDQVRQQILWMERDAHDRAERAAQHKFNLLEAAKGGLLLRLTGIQQFDDFEVFEHANRDDVVSSGVEVPDTASNTRGYDGKGGMYDQWVEQEHIADLAGTHAGKYLDELHGVGVGYIWHELYQMTLKKFGYDDEADMYHDSQRGTGPFRVKNEDLPNTWDEEFSYHIRYPKGFAAAFNSIKITPELVRRAYSKRAGNILAASGYAAQETSKHGQKMLRTFNDQLKKFLAWRKTEKGGGSSRNFEKGLALMQAVQAGMAKMAETPNAVFDILGSVEDAVNQVEKDLKSLEYLADSAVEKTDDAVSDLDALIRSTPKEQREKVEVQRPKEEEEGRQTLGSGVVLTSGMPEFEKEGVLRRIMQGRDSDDPDKKSIVEKLAGADWMQNFVDLSRPIRNLHDKALGDLKVDRNSALWDYYNVHGKIHAYLGKGYYTVERAERKFIDPMIEAFRRHKSITQERWGEYLFVRRAPSFNRHLQLQYEDRMKEIASRYKKGEKEGKKEGEIKIPEDQNSRWHELRKRGARFSGVETDIALARVKEIEADADFAAFLRDKANPLQTFYDMNKDALSQKTNSQLIEGEVDGKGRAEEARMIAAASYHKWGKNDSIASTEAGADGVKLTDDYSYAPMQGFEGNDEYLFDREQAFDTLGRAPTATGRAWDQPKQKFMQHGAYGRQKNPEGKDGAWLPAFKAVQGVAQEQYFNDSIRSGKNEVSRSFGALFNMMRAASLKDSKEKDEYENAKKLVNPDMLTFLDDMTPELQKEIKAEFQDTFEKDFKFEETVEQYVWDDEEVLDENNKAQPRLGVEQKVLNTAYRNDPHVFVYREGGIPQFIQFKKNRKGSQMANALKNMQYEPLGAFSKGVNVGTRFMAKMYTSMNPIFIIPNFFRDFGAAAIHLTEDDKKELFWDTMNINTMRKHAKGIFKAEVMLSKGENPLKKSDVTAENAKALLAEAESSGDYSPLYQFAKAAGAKVGYFRHDSVLEQMEGLQKRVNPNSLESAKEKADKFFGYVNHMNSAVENSIRMSSFWAAIKKGWTVERAVDVARNITVDFNQKGNFTQQLGAYFVFFGASVNALDRLLRSIRTGSAKRNAALITGIVGASMVTSIFNRIFDEDPEDDETKEKHNYDTINSHTRDTNLVMGMPDWVPGNLKRFGSTGFFKMPLPLGYNAFWAIGQALGDAFASQTMGAHTGGFLSGTARVIQAVSNAGNPFGGANLSTMIIPTLAKPLFEIYLNENFMGKKIHYANNPWEAESPAYERDPKMTAEHWSDLSKVFNKLWGGTDSTQGTLHGMMGGNVNMTTAKNTIRMEIGGAHMQHLLYSYLGGMGQIANTLFGAGYQAAKGQARPPGWNDVPLISRFVSGSTFGASTRSDQKAVRQLVENAKNGLRDAESDGGPAVAAKYKKDNKHILALVPVSRKVDSQKSSFRRQRQNSEKAYKAGSITFDQFRQTVEEIEEKELMLYTSFVIKARKLGIDV